MAIRRAVRPGSSLKRARESVLSRVRSVARAVAAIRRSWAPRRSPLRWTWASRAASVLSDRAVVVADGCDGEYVREEGALSGLASWVGVEQHAGEVFGDGDGGQRDVVIGGEF